MPAIENHSTVPDYMPYIISDDGNSLNLNDQGLLSTIENVNDQYTFIQDPEYLNLIKQNEMEIAGVKFKLTDSIWDFSSKAPDTVADLNLYRFRFDELNTVSDYYKTIVKLWLLDSLIHYGIHRPVVYLSFIVIRDFVHYLYSEKIYSLNTVSAHNVSSFIDKQDISTQSATNKRARIRKLMMFYYQITEQNVNEPLIEYLDTTDIQKLNAESINGKMDLLPQSFMKPLINLLETILYDERAALETRIMAGIILIGTQTGIRPQELCILPYDCLVEKSIDGISYTELHYLSTKDVKGAGTTEERTFANETTCKAVKTIKELQTSKYLGNVKYNKLAKYFKALIINNAEQLNCVSDQPREEFDGKPIKVESESGTKYINIPKMKQFRVYLASELQRRGYNDFAIASLLGHKDAKMLGYYVRPIAKSEEDKIYRDMFLRDVIEDDLKIIGPRGDEYTARINTFMESHKGLDIRSSLREIADDIDGLMPMKVIPGGFCICPAPKMSCEAMNKDNADSIYCAYGLCSNQSHLYFDMPFHLSQLRNCETAVLYNTENEYIQEAEKELYKAQFICKSLLKPEMDELKDLLNRKGSDYIAQKHPEMKAIIDSLANTEKEITTWETATI